MIQDVDLPVDRAEAFLDFLLAEIGILPVWVCPIRPADPALPFALYPLEARHALRELRLLGRGREPRLRTSPATSTAWSSAG